MAGFFFFCILQYLRILSGVQGNNFGVLESPTNIEVVEASSNKVTLRWSEDSGGFATQDYLITYWPAVGEHRERNESCRTQNICEINGLQPETEYKFKILAVNPRGYGPYSEEIIIKTKHSGEFVIQDALRWNYSYFNPTCAGPTRGINPCKDVRICSFAAASLALGGWPTLCGWVAKGVPKVCCGLPLVLGRGLMKKVDEEISKKRECGTKIFSRELSETENEFLRILGSLPEIDISDPDKFDPPIDLDEKPVLIPPLVNTESIQGDFAWMVSIRKNGSHLCGGSLINRKHILTVAHCVRGNKDQYTVHVGNLYVDDGYVFHVNRIAVHPKYNFGITKNLAVLTLRGVISSPLIPHICLPVSTDDTDLRGMNTTFLRWEKADSNNSKRHSLRMTDGITIVPVEECQRSYIDKFPPDELEDFICATNQNDTASCQEDYGGLLMYKDNSADQTDPTIPWTLIGVDTFGYSCGSSKSFRLYTKVSSHLNWIVKTTNK